MNEKHVSIILFLLLVCVCVMTIYFGLFYPPTPDPESLEKIDTTAKPVKEAPKANAKIPDKPKAPKETFSQKIRSYRKDKEVAKLTDVIQNPSSLASSKSLSEPARIRAFALRKLLEIQTKEAIKAYLKYLEPIVDPDITLTALSALDPKLSKPEIKKAIHFLIFHTPYKPVRAKASMVYETL